MSTLLGDNVGHGVSIADEEAILHHMDTFCERIRQLMDVINTLALYTKYVYNHCVIIEVFNLLSYSSTIKTDLVENRLVKNFILSTTMVTLVELSSLAQSKAFLTRNPVVLDSIVGIFRDL